MVRKLRALPMLSKRRRNPGAFKRYGYPLIGGAAGFAATAGLFKLVRMHETAKLAANPELESRPTTTGERNAWTGLLLVATVAGAVYGARV